MVSNSLGNGAFGDIKECLDLKHPDKKLVIKLSENYKMLGKEIECLLDIRKQAKN